MDALSLTRMRFAGSAPTKFRGESNRVTNDHTVHFSLVWRFRRAEFGAGMAKTEKQWQPVSLGGGCFKIVNRTSGLVFDSGGNVAPDSPLKQWPWVASPNLQWQLIKVN